MSDRERNTPCRCGSGKKTKKCCGVQSRGLQPSIVAPSPRTVMSSSRPITTPRGAERWPVVRAYVPILDVWRATGLGTAGIVRQQPNGLYSAAFFIMELLQHGLTGAFGDRDATLESLDELMRELDKNLPPMEEGSPEMAARFAWGARAFAEARGVGFDDKQLAPYFALLPRAAGSSRAWYDGLIGSAELTPPELLRVIDANASVNDRVPDAKEVMIVTEMTFDIADADAIVTALNRAEPAFQYDGADGDTEVFSWTRAYPKNHWSPLQALGGRQILGSVHVSREALVAKTKALSMGARLVQTLRQLVGPALRLRGTQWRNAQELFATPTSTAISSLSA